MNNKVEFCECDLNVGVVQERKCLLSGRVL